MRAWFSLKRDVVLARLGSDANLLDLALMGVALGLPLLLLVLEFPIVHDAADGRPLVGSHLNEIQIGFPGPRQSLVGADDAQQLAVGGNDSDGRNADLLVDPLIAFYTNALSKRLSYLKNPKTDNSTTVRRAAVGRSLNTGISPIASSAVN